MTSKKFEEKIEKLRYPERITQLEVSKTVDIIMGTQSVEWLLDIGTGSALFAESFYVRSQRVVGVDIDPEMLVAARHYNPQIDFLLATAENLPFADDSFEISFIGMALHHAIDRGSAGTETGVRYGQSGEQQRSLDQSPW